MIHFELLPPTPAQAVDHSFVQMIHMRDDDREIGRAVWAAACPAEGVSQLIELWITPAHRRAGHGRQLLQAVIEQSRAFHRLGNENLRRLWTGVGHKTSVIGRSFLTSASFHHIGSAAGLLNDQDLMIYVRSLD